MNLRPIITDTHTHLYSEEFDQDRDEMIQRAIDAGITRFFYSGNRCGCDTVYVRFREKLS
ncbi:hypothetical protein AAGS39_13160 [Flavobacterium sp. CGRL2]